MGDFHLIPLFPLCQISVEEIKSITFQWASQIRETGNLETVEVKNMLTLLGGFIAHRIKNLTLNDINHLIGGFKMEDTQVGKDLIALGWEEGREEGKYQLLLNQISHKFGTIPEDIINRIQTIKNKKQLDTLGTAILDLTDLEELKKILN